MFKVNKNTRTMSMTFFDVTYFTPFVSVSMVDFEQVNASWEAATYRCFTSFLTL